MTGRREHPRERWGLVAGLGVVVLLVLADTWVPFEISGTYAIGALVAAMFAPAFPTACVAALAVALALLSGTWGDPMSRAEWLVRALLCLALGGLAAISALVRDRREERLVRLTLIAETAQRAVLRTLPSTVGRVGLAARYVSATTDAAVGGDLYEVATTPFGVRLVVGDVRGKGLEAVQNAAAVLVAFRQAASNEPDLAGLARTVDDAVTRLYGEEDFVTAIFVELGPRTVSLVNCGHFPPMSVEPSGLHPLDTGDPTTPLGLGPEPTVTTHTWAPGARLLFYTDGLVEARNRRREFFSLETQAAVLIGGTPDEALDRLLDRLRRFARRQLTDDVALLLVENQDVPEAGDGAAGDDVVATSPGASPVRAAERRNP